MDIRKFVLSYYKNSINKFHIHKVEKSAEAQKPHSHEYFQIYFITSGNLTHYVGKESSALSYGDMFIIPPGITHHVSFKPGTLFYSLSFSADFLNTVLADNILAKNFLFSLCKKETQSIKPKISVATEEIRYIEGMMEHILKEFTEKPLGYYSVIQTYVELLLTVLARNYFESAKPNISDHFKTDKQLVLHSIDYIESNYKESISLAEITKKSMMSKNKFNKLFIDITGCSFKEYVNMCRIKKACEYIRQGYKISVLYSLCGYCDFSTFYRNFKKIMGVSPNAYKYDNLQKTPS